MLLCRLAVAAVVAVDPERIAQLVRHGQPCAEVRLEICNAPREHAFEPDRYGDTIVVERTLSATGSSEYRLRAADEMIVSHEREDLEKAGEPLMQRLVKADGKARVGMF